MPSNQTKYIFWVYFLEIYKIIPNYWKFNDDCSWILFDGKIEMFYLGIKPIKIEG